MEQQHHVKFKIGTLNIRSLVGLSGVFIGAITAGLNSRSGSLGLADMRGGLGFGLDEFSWVNTSYAAGELAVMPFASWFAVTFAMRRYHLVMISMASVLAILTPLTTNINTLCLVRFLHGVAAGGLIPLLMSAALRILPLNLRLHGLALYAMTATFVPNISVWLVGIWTDVLVDWRWIYWQFLIFAPFSVMMVWWGFPREHIQWSRFSGINLKGLATGAPGLIAVAIAIDQGNRLDWFNSPVICWALTFGIVSTLLYALTEWHHPMPFVKLQLLGRRNLGILLSAFVFLLIVFASGAVVPTNFLSLVWGYRSADNAPIALLIGLPQVLLGSLVAVLIYQKWVDARLVLATGLCFIAVACFWGAQLDSSWIWREFLTLQLVQAIGQPLAVVPLLFLTTSVVHPSEGPYISGCVNTLRALGSLMGGAAVGRLLELRERFHSEILVDRLGAVDAVVPQNYTPSELVALIAPQVATLATADIYRVLGCLALILVPVVLLAQYIPPPTYAEENHNKP